MDNASEKKLLRVLEKVENAVKVLSVQKLVPVGVSATKTLNSEEKGRISQESDIFSSRFTNQFIDKFFTKSKKVQEITKSTKDNIEKKEPISNKTDSLLTSLVNKVGKKEPISNKTDSFKTFVGKLTTQVSDPIKNVVNVLTKKKREVFKGAKIENQKTEKKESSGLGLKGINLMAFGAGMKVIIESLVVASKIKVENVNKTFKCLGEFVNQTSKMAGVAIKMTVAFGAFAYVIKELIVPSLISLSNLSIEDITKSVLGIGTVVGGIIIAIKTMEKIKTSDVAKSVLGIGAFTAMIKFLIIPLIMQINSIPFDQVLTGLGSLSLIVLGFSGLIRLSGEILTKGGGLLASAAGLAGIMAITFAMGYLFDNIKKFSTNFDWVQIGKNLGFATLSIIAFGTLVTVIGGLLVGTGGIGALLAGVGIAAILTLSLAMGSIADTIKKFDGINGDNLSKIGTGLSSLGIGLVSFFGGIVGGAIGGGINAITSFFGLDPVSTIEKFAKLDADKLLKVGTALALLGSGLNSLNTTLNIKDISSNIQGLSKPIVELSFALDKFNDSYSKLDKLKNNTELNVKVSDNNSIQNKLIELNLKEIEIQTNQLAQLQENGKILKIISEKISENNSSTIISSNNGKSEPKINNPSFNTKNNYINAINMANMSLDG